MRLIQERSVRVAEMSQIVTRLRWYALPSRASRQHEIEWRASLLLYVHCNFSWDPLKVITVGGRWLPEEWPSEGSLCEPYIASIYCPPPVLNIVTTL